MDKEQAAAALNGNEYRDEGSPELFAQMKAAGLVAVFGYSDDGTELRGAIDEELGCAPFLVTRGGLLKSECKEEEDCPYFQQLAKGAASITPSETERYFHCYETVLPHATFEIVEDGEPFCEGIVFSLADAPQVVGVIVEAPANV